VVKLYRHDEIEPRSADDAKQNKVEAVEIVVDRDYRVLSGEFEAVLSRYENSWFDVLGDPEEPSLNAWYNSTLSHLIGETGDLAVVYAHQNVANGSVQFTLTLGLDPDAFERWQYRAWTAVREAAEQEYYASRQLLADRRERLVEELKAWDALTLRRMEREEIMKSVLRWLFGPEFELVPADLQQFFEPIEQSPPAPAAATAAATMLGWAPMFGGAGTVFDPEGSVGIGNGSVEPGGVEVPPERPAPPPLVGLAPTEENWQRVLQYGEMIKFLHQAVEWENVLYLMYPYFWDSPANWDFKRFLRHPDALHREFLRAGSARVVLTVRPGWEVDFAKFVERGALGDDHPYLTIAQEIEAYALTNYPGIPPANPEGQEEGEEGEVGERERGKLIGRWYEYTPTSALDLAIDTPLPDMA
jgi:hypothetical protein